MKFFAFASTLLLYFKTLLRLVFDIVMGHWSICKWQHRLCIIIIVMIRRGQIGPGDHGHRKAPNLTHEYCVKTLSILGKTSPGIMEKCPGWNEPSCSGELEASGERETSGCF